MRESLKCTPLVFVLNTLLQSNQLLLLFIMCCLLSDRLKWLLPFYMPFYVMYINTCIVLL